MDSNTLCNATITSSNIKIFWSKVAPVVLDTDKDFSKLPKYYHKGHIRVITKYGGAVNFSLGFYDPESGRVNPDISFEFSDSKSHDGERTFYLSTDISDAKAFERFIPVFNDTYRGLFEITFDGSNYVFNDLRDKDVEPYRSTKSRQVIYFGAPGTGKSHAVDKILRTEAPKRSIRTTFHPDTDYSSFVGCFKPTMRNGNIEYAFTAQAFINAYVGAWSDITHPFYLVIEEINRGNCAQIFGDIFQLLDRNQTGESSYSIKPDTDLQSYIADKLSLIPNIPEEIRSGNEMRLPSNLFIYATMNTSDQSLFPIDSAFKRRWDWKYTAIKPADNDHLLVVDNTRYSWTSFIKNVNAKIYDLTKSEDKQLGYWFIKPDENNSIDWELFVSKALFYIWNDIVKDYASMEKEDSPFGKKFSFTTFFDEDGNPIKEQVIAFLEALKVEHIKNIPSKDLSTTDNDGSNGNGSRYSYVLNGVEVKGIGQVVRSVIDKLCESMDYDALLHDFDTIVKKTHDNGSGMRLGTASDLGPDANGRMRWWKEPFTSKDGKVFSVVSLWPDSYYPTIKKFVENYPTIFPNGLIQNESEQ